MKLFVSDTYISLKHLNHVDTDRVIKRIVKYGLIIAGILWIGKMI